MGQWCTGRADPQQQATEAESRNVAYHTLPFVYRPRSLSCTLWHTARYHEGADEDLHGVAVLIQRRRSHLEQPLVWTRLRRPHLEHFALDAQRIPRTHGPWPAALLNAGTNNAARRREIALDQEPHGDRGGVPPAGGQSAEDGVTRRCLIEMEGLWIEGGGKSGDLLRIDPQPPGAERLPHGKIFEIALSHGSVSPLYTRRGAATSQWDRTRHRAPPLRR